MREQCKPGEHGFTLLELIVVIGVFSVFATMAYGGLDRVLQARKLIEQSLTRTQEYQKAYQKLRGDFENAAGRGIRDGDGAAQPAFGYDGYVKRIEFTRGGWANLLDLPRASMQRVSYFLDDAKLENKTLVRRTWPVLDRAPQTVPQDTVLLEHVEEMKWRFLDPSREWQSGWPPESGFGTTAAAIPRTPATAAAAGLDSNLNSSPPPPLALELTLRTRDWGELRWLFKVGPDGLNTVSSPVANPAVGGVTP